MCLRVSRRRSWNARWRRRPMPLTGRIKEKDSPMPKIKCLLVDDHTLFRQGVRRLLETESDFAVVGEAADGGEAVEKARELRPDIVLAEGNSVKEIAVILGLSVKTVEAQKFNLMRKLDIHNKAQLVTYAIQKKIIKIPVNQ